MTKFLLHGGYTRDANEANEAFYRELVKDLKDGDTILLVYFAADASEYEILREAHKKQVLAQSEGRSFNFEIASKEKFMEQVEGASVLYIGGGSTNRLFSILEQFPNLKASLVDKTVAGSSAGAYVLSAFNYDKSANTVRAGLGLVPIRTICHYKSPTNEHTGEEAVRVMESSHQNLPLVILKDREWKVFEI